MFWLFLQCGVYGIFFGFVVGLGVWRVTFCLGFWGFFQFIVVFCLFCLNFVVVRVFFLCHL